MITLLLSAVTASATSPDLLVYDHPEIEIDDNTIEIRGDLVFSKCQSKGMNVSCDRPEAMVILLLSEGPEAILGTVSTSDEDVILLDLNGAKSLTPIRSYESPKIGGFTKESDLATVGLVTPEEIRIDGVDGESLEIEGPLDIGEDCWLAFEEDGVSWLTEVDGQMAIWGTADVKTPNVVEPEGVLFDDRLGNFELVLDMRAEDL